MDLSAVAGAFDQLARRYYALIDDGPSDQMEWLTQVELALADLYAAALRLPPTEPTDSEPPAERPLDQMRLMTKITGKVGKDFDYYRFVFDPFRDDEEPVGGTIAEDLVSVYRDLHVGTDLVAASAALADVVWTWRFNFQFHWGRHAAAALYAIYASQLTLNH